MAVILDGNRRWATRRGLPAAAGYRRGGDRVVEVLPECERAGVEVVTLWSLSTDNLDRRGDELEPLIDVIAEVFARLSDERRWRVRLIGNTAMLPARLRTDIARVLTRTRGGTGMTVNIAVAYSGRDEITRAVTALVAEHRAAGTLDRLAHGVAPADLARHLDTAGQPDIDLLIRTSGERRLSGFLAWQAATAELYFCDTLWPDFGRRHLHHALDDYAARERRFGR